MKRIFLVLALFLATPILLNGQHKKRPAAPSSQACQKWGYGVDVCGPLYWGSLKDEYRECSEGKLQSPVDLSALAPIQAPKIVFNYPRGSDLGWQVLNNTAKYTIEMHYVNKPKEQRVSVNYPDGSPENRYYFDELHFHAPNEHLMPANLGQFKMEMHVVFKTADGKRAVAVAVLIKGGSLINMAFAPIWSRIPQGGVIPQLYLGRLLPNTGSYFTYDGSLTTPPCSQIVKFLILKDPVILSEGQVSKYTRYYCNTARPIQRKL
ncbi:MAG TPA: carbonic anhydrase family protein [Blastocatellia bacterium]|nr:carbonic anhydrase family protein [Blastocatellia bacterium]